MMLDGKLLKALMLNPSYIWTDLIIHPGNKASGGSKKREYDRACRRYKCHELVIGLIMTNEPELFLGKLGIFVPENRINKLLDKIQDSCSSRDLKLCRNFFIKGLANGVKKEKWKLIIPSTSIILPRQKSPFTPDSFIPLKALSYLKDQFKLSIEEPTFYQNNSSYLHRVRKIKKFKESNSSQLHAGQIIFSAILNGGLLNKKWIDTLAEGIKNNVIVDNDLLWIDLEIVEKNKEDENSLFRRWFPDPLTSLLILRWKKIHGNHWPKCISHSNNNKSPIAILLEQYILSLEVTSKPTFNEFMKAVRTHLGLRIPQFLVNYAINYDIGLSLSPTAWTRLYSSSVLIKPEFKKNQSQNSEDKNFRAFKKIVHKLPNEFDDQLSILKNFKSLFKANNAVKTSTVMKKIEHFLNKKQKVSPILFALIDWSTEMLTSERLNGKKVVPNTVIRYLSAIAEPLLINATILNLTGTEIIDIDWLELYDATLEDKISQKDRRYKIGRINDFHYFLTQRYHCSSINIKYDGRVINSVNVNIVTPNEFTATRNYLLNDENLTDREKEIISIVMLLGYRCGLRANEALTIKISELHDGQNIDIIDSFKVSRPELIIKYNILGKLKSNQSIRRVPLVLLLTNELKELLDWKKKRIRELRTNSKAKISDEPLFCFQGDSSDVPKYHEIFPPILNALKLITRDPNVNFHHLRHSFINFLFLRLMSDEIEEILPSEWCYDIETNKNLLWKVKDSDNKSLKSSLMITTESKPSKKILYLISLLSGHIDPDVSIKSYLHLLDWAMGHSIRQIEQPLSIKAQVNLLNLTKEKLKAYRYRNELKSSTSSKALIAIEAPKAKYKHTNKQLIKMMPLQSVNLEPIVAKEKQHPSPFYLHNILTLVFTGKPKDLIAEEYEIQKGDLYKWVYCAEKLAQTKTSRNTLRFFKSTKKLINQSNYSKIRIIPGYSPTIPIKPKDRETALKIYKKLHELYKEDTKITQEGLNLFVNESSFEKMLITTRTNSKRKLYVEFLKKLVLKSQIRVDLEPNPINVNANTTEEQAHKNQMDYWRKELGLPKQNIILTNKSRKQATANPNGKITIWIANNGKLNNTRPINYIFRFALFMGMVSLNICGNRALNNKTLYP